MAPDEMDQDHRQKCGREEPEDTVQDQVRAEKHQIRRYEKEIRGVEEEIRGVEEEIRGVGEKIRGVEEEIREKEKVIREKEKEKIDIEFLRQQTIRLRQEIITLRQQSSPQSVPEAPPSAETPLTVETMKNLLEDAMPKLVRDNIMAKPAISTLSMSPIATNVAYNVLKVAGFTLVDGSYVEPAGEVSVLKEWEFDMGQYAGEEDCYEPFLKHMVKYLNAVHAVQIRKDPPREPGCCRLLDVHKLQNVLELEAELGDRTLKIKGNLDAVFIPRKRGVLQFEDSLLGGVKVKHLSKHGAPTVGTANSGQSAVLEEAWMEALMEALAVYAYSDFPQGIFLLTSYDENVVMELKDEEIWYWVQLNFAQAMDKIAAFLKREDVQKFLEESEEPVSSRKRRHISERKRSVRKKLKIGLRNEELRNSWIYFSS